MRNRSVSRSLRVLPFKMLVALLLTAPLAALAAPKQAAIFVANRLGADYDDRLPVVEDLVTSAVSGLGLGVISKEMVLDAVSSFEQGNPENAIDALLSDQTSALRLSQNLGADYVFFVSLTSYDKEERQVKAYGVDYLAVEYLLRLSYRIVDGYSGETLAARTASATRSVQQDANSQTRGGNVFAGLVEKAAADLASDIKSRLNQSQIREASRAASQVTFDVTVTLSDIAIPMVSLDENGNASISETMTNVEALAVTVELDGITIGTTGTSGLQATRGLHRLRLDREDLVPWERMVNIADGTKLNIAMQLNAEGLRRWMEKTQFLQDLKIEAEMGRATADVLRGHARMLEQSGFKWDIKVDTTEGMTFEDNRSVIGR